MSNKTFSYVSTIIQALPVVCDNYNLQLSTIHLKLIKHVFAEKRLDFQFKKTNTNGSQTVILNVQYLFITALKLL